MTHFSLGISIGNPNGKPRINLFSHHLFNTLLLNEECCSQKKSSPMKALSLDSGLWALKPATEAFLERNRLKHNLFWPPSPTPPLSIMRNLQPRPYSDMRNSTPLSLLICGTLHPSPSLYAELNTPDPLTYTDLLFFVSSAYGEGQGCLVPPNDRDGGC